MDCDLRSGGTEWGLLVVSSILNAIRLRKQFHTLLEVSKWTFGDTYLESTGALATDTGKEGGNRGE